MHLTTYTDYSLRVLMYLKLHQDRLCNVAEVSEYFRISNNHIVKVVNNLGKLGLIETFRGKGGGIRLDKNAGKQKVGELVRMLEPEKSLVQCVSKEGELCAVAPMCNLILVINDAVELFYAELDKYTVDDIVDINKSNEIKLDISL